MATAAAAMALTVGSGTAEAKPGDGLNKILHPNKVHATTTSTQKAASGLNIGSILSSIAPRIYNPGPFTIGRVTSTPTGVIVKPPVPGSKPFPQITGIQLPFWTVNNGTPVPAA